MTSRKDELKNNLENYLKEHHNITNPLKSFRCLNPEHDDSTPSMILNKHNKTFCKCFGCGANYDIFDIIGLDYGLTDFSEQYKKACELYNIPYSNSDFLKEKEAKKEPARQPEPKAKRDLTTYINERAKELNKALPYLTARGISEATAKRFNIGYDACFTEHLNEETAQKVKDYYATYKTEGNNEAVIIPNDSQSLNARFINPPKPYNNSQPIRYAKVSNGIFNLKALDSDDVIFITEGVFDALSIEQLGYRAIALNGVNNVSLFIEHLRQLKTDISKPLIITLDKDDAGRKASEELQQQLKEIGVICYNLPAIWGDYKDANEYLTADKEGLNQRLEKVLTTLNEGILKDYQQKKSTLAYIDEFISIMESTETPFISTGFNQLDNELDGGLYEGLYILGAVSSLGKTTYCLQIADQIARQGNDVIIFSLEMSRNELIAKSISRNTAIYCLNQRKPITQYASTTRTITTREKRTASNLTQQQYINYAIADYKTYAGNVYIYEANGLTDINDIRETIKEHINITRHKPVVFIDYLQIIQPAKETRYNMTDKQQIDYNVTELKRLTREFKNPIIAISSFNRTSYNAPVDLQSFKESGAIEYASDVLIGLQFINQTEETDLQAEKKKETRQLEAVILKNRNGQTGGKLKYKYYTPFNLFAEAE